MRYTSESLITRLFDIVSTGEVHKDYQRTVDVAKWCYQMMTGDQQEEIIIRYKRREVAEQQEQRIHLTNSRTQYVSNKVFNLFSEVHRSDRTVNQIVNTKRNEEAVAGLLDNLKEFNHDQSLEKYLDERYRYLNFYDPNAFIVVEFINEDPINEKPKVYPFEVASHEAAHFEYHLGELQFLLVRQMQSYQTHNDDEKSEGYRFTLYGKGVSYVIQHIPENAVFEIPAGYEVKTLPYAETDQDERFIFREFKTGTDAVPAMRVGYLPDPTTNGRTFHSPEYPAEKTLTDLIWRKSEYDLAHALHGFYQKFIYIDDCPVCDGTGDATSGNASKCNACDGTGIQHHMSTSDIIEVMRPDQADQHIPLSEMVHYEQIPMDLIRLQKEDLKDLERDVFNGIFGSNVLERSEVAVTATEKNYDWRAVNNTLLPYADKYVQLFKFIVRTIAVHRQEADGLVVQYAFPADFNLESVADLIIDRQAAVSSNAPYAILQHIDLNIVQKQNNDNPGFVQAYRSREQFRPLRDKSLEERIFIITNLLSPDDPERVLYTYFDRIMQDVFIANPRFPLLDYPTQRTLVYAEVDRVIQQNQTPPLFPTDDAA